MRKLSLILLLSAMMLPGGGLLLPDQAMADGYYGHRRHHSSYDRNNWRGGHGGRWVHGHHHGRSGWWWVVGASWLLYPMAVYPYPDPYQRPITVIQAPPNYYYPAPTYVAPATPPVSATPTSPTYQDEESGQTCREYQTTIKVGNTNRQGYGTACQQPDGTWRVVP